MNIFTIVNCIHKQFPCENFRGPLLRHQHTIMVGAAYELPRVRPSGVDVAGAIGICRTQVKERLVNWHEMDWRDRHGWLLLISERLRRETKPVDAPLCR